MLSKNKPRHAPASQRRRTAVAQQTTLIAAACAASRLAVAPFSGFNVGAALLTPEGDIVSGANVESASYGLTCCAERVALFKALTEGRKEFVAVAVVAPTPGGPMPCGACRQLLAEYALEALVWVADSRSPRGVRQFTVRQLLPEAFLHVPGRSGSGQGTRGPLAPRKAVSARRSHLELLIIQ